LALVELKKISKEYRKGPVCVRALKEITLSFEEGDFTAIMGPSGSGKSTLLNILGCLDQPTSGRYFLGGREISLLSDDERSEIRSRHIGFIFQSYNLIPQLTVIENIEVPLFYQGWPPAKSRDRAEETAHLVGLSDRLNHRPSELSGGEQQRVAIARALASNPLIILADEPTGNLDSATGQEIMRLLGKLNREGKTLLMVTHDEGIASYARATVRLQDGEVVSDGAKVPEDPKGDG